MKRLKRAALMVADILILPIRAIIYSANDALEKLDAAMRRAYRS